MKSQQMQRQAIRQGFCNGPASGAHGLLAYFPDAAEQAAPVVHDGSASTSIPDPSPQQNEGLDIHVDLDVSMGEQPADEPTDTHEVDDVVEPPPSLPTLTRCCAPLNP